MKFLLIGISVIFVVLLIAAICKFTELKNINYNQPEILTDKKILTVYYSNNGNTKSVAENIHSVVGGDIKEIELIEKYPNNIFTMSKLVRKQIKDDYLPKTEEPDISEYDLIFVGSPVWNFSISLPVKAFLKNNNFENKIAIPFFTCSGGVNRSKITKEFMDYTDAKEVKKPLFMFENGIFLKKEQIIKWLNKI